MPACNLRVGGMQVLQWCVDYPEMMQAAIPLATTSRHFLATGRARFGVSMVRMEVLLDRSQNWPTIVWQKLL